MLSNKTVLLCVSGGIAAYKIPNLASMLKKQHCNVHTIMTENASKFITQNTFEALTGNKCIIDTFDRNHSWEIEHISLAKKADVVMIAPATANIIGKLANGIADDMLTTTVLACKCPVYISPAMNVNMYQNAIVQDNISKLKKFGYNIISPSYGYLACGATGDGKMPEPYELYQYIEKEIMFPKDMKGLKVLITAGPTQEAIDPVRYITNHSSGKMGYAIAKNAMLRGADVTLISGSTSLSPVPFIKNIQVVSAQDMFEQVSDNFDNCDILIMSAAVADYTPLNVSDNKIKKHSGDMSIDLKRTIDILEYAGKSKKSNQFICGFSMETENLISNSKAKLIKKKVDMIAANNLKNEGAGFKTDTNILTVITENNEIPFGLLSKDETAKRLLDEIITQVNSKKALAFN